MTKEVTLNIDDIKNLNLAELMDHIPCIETQKAMAEAIDQLIAKGMSKEEAVRLVFENNKLRH